MTWPVPDNEIVEKVEQHDRYHLEVKLEYPLDPKGKRQDFEVEAWFFVPANLAVDRETYTTPRFYADVTDHIRFQTPRLTLEQLLAPDNAASPFARLATMKDRIRSGVLSAADVQAHTFEAKLLACILRSSLRDLARMVSASLRSGRPADRADAERLVSRSLDSLPQVLGNWRSIGDGLLAPNLDPTLRGVHRLVDEYLSLTAESYALHLLGPDHPWPPELRQRLAALSRAEEQVRRERGWASVVDPDTRNEPYIYRHSILKKFVSDALYLKIARTDASKGMQALAFGVAAGVAMAFATAVTFLAARLAPMSWTLFVVLVVSYVAKDRIKEGFRDVFRHWADQHLSDHHVKVIDPATGRRIGSFWQKFAFVRPKDVPDQIMRARSVARTEFLAERDYAEEVFRYRKMVSVAAKRSIHQDMRATAVTDIFRFSVRRFLYAMDEPVRRILVMDPTEPISVRTKASKTYHVNVVLRFRQRGKNVPFHLRKLRVVLNRRGIERVEEVALGPT